MIDYLNSKPDVFEIKGEPVADRKKRVPVISFTVKGRKSRDVVEAIDGPVAVAACVDGAALPCPTVAVCPVRGGWEPLNQAIRATLTRMTLADMRSSTASLPA